MKYEKIVDHDKIIYLQTPLLEKEEVTNALGPVFLQGWKKSSVVAQKFRSYYKKLLMERLLKEKDKVTMRDQDCTKNIMVFRLPEKQEEYVGSKV